MRGPGLSHVVVMYTTGPYCSECQQRLTLFRPNDPRLHVPKQEPAEPNDFTVTKWMKQLHGVNPEQRFRDLGLVDDELPVLRDIENDPPIEGRHISQSEAVAKGLEWLHNGKAFGQIAVKLKGLQRYWGTRPEDDH